MSTTNPIWTDPVTNPASAVRGRQLPEPWQGLDNTEMDFEKHDMKMDSTRSE
jgi:hypothetical protein